MTATSEGTDTRIRATLDILRAHLPFFHEHLGNVASEWKADSSRVTWADRELTTRLTRALGDGLLGDPVCSEENDPATPPVDISRGFSWILDPIDGTNNYAAGTPLCGISLALLHDGVPAYGFIYDASRRHILHGGPGRGVHEDDQPRRIRGEPWSRQSFAALHFPMAAAPWRLCEPLMHECKVRSLGSSALNLAYVAAGYFDAYLEFSAKVWDFAAGAALLEAAGIPLQWLGENPFPLRQFHVDLPAFPFVACTQACRPRIDALLAGN